jgi:FkbH-like protein
MQKDILIIRNTTIENTFQTGYKLSGYDNWNEEDIEEAGLVIWFYLISLNKTHTHKKSELDSYKFKVEFIVNQCKRKNKPLLLLTLPFIFDTSFQSQDDTISKSVLNFNNWLYTLQSIEDSIWIIDINQFSSIAEIIHPKYYWTSLVGVNPKLSLQFREWLESEIDCIVQRNRKKCLILDLDNTLWKGIIAEDGTNGISCDGDYPGNVFNYFQMRVQELAESGILIALCSKNAQKDIEDFWKNSTRLSLKWDSIIAHRINWRDKSSNILEIAKELNIGLESIVFIDDNPTERGWVESLLPEVTVPNFPENDFEIPSFIDKVFSKHFKKGCILKEDKDKLLQYQTNKKRTEYLNTLDSFDDYLKKLGVKITLNELNTSNIQRVSQITMKTNQFNFTLKKFDIDELIEILRIDEKIVYCINVADKFGDYGLTGVLFGSIVSSNEFYIDNFLLSCRILGKGVEKIVIDEIISDLKKRGLEKIKGKLIYSNRNEPASNFVKQEFSTTKELDYIEFEKDIKNG